eukprot:NODE_6707_length_493_cov_44.259009_g5919_i0.p1 GENE.NODE_6707_length_493_cov_44.259009_g5919_i0~~NODE_6707_length_493_cov_44.259009_g5919_i0.p1  ORF type:complete len:135 (-),score=31.68 NODE_6707_length_493_cov_44.259009_g5919_i0:63-467(-)
MAASSLNKTKIIKKTKKHVDRYQCDRFNRVAKSWRKPTGIDGRIRRKYRGLPRMPKIGRGSNKKTRHLLPNGLKKFVIENEKDLDVLLMNNRTYCAELAQGVSAKKRASIVEKAKAMNVAVTNGHARVKKQSAE